MTPDIWVGAVFAAIGGVLQGAFAVPMGYAKKWNHENIWFVFVLIGFVILPWLLTLAFVPSLAQVYAFAPPGALVLIILCGLGWGVGVVLVGIAFRMLGIGLGFAIILGLSALLGSLTPFLIQTPEKIWTSQGRLYLFGTFTMLGGIALVSLAGSMRDRDNRGQSGRGVMVEQRFAAGLFIAIAAGVLSSLLSDAIAFTSSLVDLARKTGISPVWASNVVLAPATTSGFLANGAFCIYRMRINHSAKLFWSSDTARYWIFGICMGTLWYGGLAVYGLAEQKIGSVIGWPIFIGAMILSSSAVGFLTGEWKVAGSKAKLWLCIGSVVIFVSLIMVSMANNY